eukprot:jgi/Tetstr1/452931/TSEL_039967.t1
MEKRLAPGIIAYPLTVTSDAQITLLANLITLTPGTLSVDVSDDRTTLYIHVLEMNDREDVIASIKNGLPDRVLGLDMLIAVVIGYIAAIALRTGFMLYLDIAIALGLVGFLSTVAFARFILQRWQIDAAAREDHLEESRK